MRFTVVSLTEIIHGLTEPLYRNSFYLGLNSGVTAILGFVFWVVAARFYPASQVGIVSALIAAVGLIANFSKFGFNVSIIRFLPSAEDKQGLINSCFAVTSLAAIIVSSIFIAGLDFWSPALSFVHHDILFPILFLLFTVGMVLLDMNVSVFVAYRHAKFSPIQSAISGLMRAILPIVMVFAGVLGLFFAWGIGGIVAVALGMLLFIPRLQPRYRPVPMIQKSVLNGIRYFSFMNYIILILRILPTLLLPLLIINILSAEVAAYFRIAWMVSSILFLTIPSAVGISLFAEGSNEPQKLRENVIKAVKLMLSLLIPGIAVLCLAGDKILLLFGGAYSMNAFNLLLVLTMSCIPVVVSEIYICIKIVQMEMKPVIFICALTATLTISISCALMPKIGIIATGIGWTLSQTIVALIIGFLVMNRGRGKTYWVKGALLFKG